MTEKEIKETIIACVDYATEYEKYPKDVLSELYKYIENWYNIEKVDEEKLDELAEEYAAKEQKYIRDVNWKVYNAYVAGYRKAMEK